jgi:chromosomal replication initiation ATPase DnaA
LDRRYLLKAKGYRYEKVGQGVAEVLQVAPHAVRSSGKHREAIKARSLMCYWASIQLGIPMTELAKKLGISQPAVSLAIKRGEKMARENGYELLL